MSYVQELIPARPAPAKAAKPVTGSRIVGVAFLTLWALLGIGLITMIVSGWDVEKFTRYGPRYLSGLWVTLSLVGLSLVLGALLSLPIAFARMSSNRFLNALAYCYVYVFRGTPLLVQTYLIHYPFGRGAILSVPKGQHEGAQSLGLPPTVTFRKIILPQALIVALRPYGNEIILMIKGSAIVAVVTVLDLMGQTRYVFSRTFDYQTYLWAAIFYLSIVELLRHAWAAIEARLTRHLKR